MMARYGWTIVLGLMFTQLLTAQHAYRAGLVPEINLNRPIGSRWALNAQLESRPLLARGTFGEGRSRFRYSLTDLSLAGARKTGPNQTLTLGYLLRMARSSIGHRLFQQYSLVQPLSAFRLGHRLAGDQTFSPEEAAEWRLRYRISLELPLSGRQVDPREMYLKLSQEQLHRFQGGGYNLELRLVPTLGLVITDESKVETGLEYRIDGFLQDRPRSTFWWKLAWYRKWSSRRR